VLLDIAMPEVDGFDVARHLPSPRPLIIFQTAYAEHALRAFEHEALDYVVKPVSRARLAEALERAQRRLAAARASAGWSPDAIGRLSASLGYAPARPARLLVRHGAGHRLVPIASIARFNAADGLVFAHTATGRYALDYTLNELEARLTDSFARTSRADLVNVTHVAGISSNGDGSATLKLNDGAEVRVSRRRAAAVRELLERP
jgi:DNA-binding LytR/AlgR family response regulator